MKAFSIRLAGASLIALAAAGCTTTGVGTGQVVGEQCRRDVHLDRKWWNARNHGRSAERRADFPGPVLPDHV